MDILVPMALFSAIFFVLGLPAAVALRDASDGWAALTADSVLYGLMLATTVVTLWTWLGLAGVVVMALAWAGFLVAAVRSKTSVPAIRFSDRGDRLYAVLMTLVLVGALLLRMHSVNFITWTGDMGAYVNWANEFARTGVLSAGWPPLLPVFLSLPAFVFGPSMTTAVLPITGLLLITSLLRLLAQLGVNRWASFVSAVLVALSVHAIWYSSFPSSESLNAPLLIVWIGSVVGIIRSGSRQLPVWIVLSGLSMLALGLLRGTGPLLLLPLIVIAILCLWYRAWSAFAFRLWLAVATGIAGALMSFWYGISVIPRYYVEMQIKSLLPAKVISIIEPLGLFRPTLLTAITMLLGASIALAIGLSIARLVSRRATSITPSSETAKQRSALWPRITTLALFGCLIVVVGVAAWYNSDVWVSLVRMGLWLTIFSLLTIALITWLKATAAQTIVVTFLGGVAVFFLGIQLTRLGIDRDHSFYLYWDRYLFSEVLPAFFIVLAIGLSLGWTRLGAALFEKLPSRRWGTPVFSTAVAVAFIVSVTLPSIPALALVSSNTFMAGAYELQAKINALVPDKTTPVLWSDTSTKQVQGFYFPNTWMAFAVPMIRSFGYDVVNINQSAPNFGPDDVITEAELRDAAACHVGKQLVVLEVDQGQPGLADRVVVDGIRISPSGTATGSMALLAQRTNTKWTTANFKVRAYTVSVRSESNDSTHCAAG